MKKTKQEKTADTLILLMLATIMVIIPATHYYCQYHGLYFSYIAHTIYNCTVLCVAVVVYSLYVYRKKIKFSQYEGIFLAICVFSVLSVYNAIDPQKAIWGESGRNEGILMLLCYYLFFYTARLLTDEKKRSAAIYIFVVVLTLHALYGLAQFYSINIFIPVYDHYYYAISGVAGNPNFMGSLMVMSCAACTGLMIYTEKLWAKILFMCLLAINTATLIFTKTMSAYVGLTAVIFTVFVIWLNHLRKQKGTKTAIVVLTMLAVSFVICVFIIDKLTYGFISAELMGIYKQFKDGINWETLASGRFLVWYNIFKMLPQYLLFGVGIDGLEQPYFERYGLLFGSYLDKAHNELLQVLITVGLPVFLLYIAVYVFVIKDLGKRIKKNSNKPVDFALMFIIIGYLVQAMFNISIIDIAPYFWIVLGLSATPLLQD